MFICTHFWYPYRFVFTYNSFHLFAQVRARCHWRGDLCSQNLAHSRIFLNTLTVRRAGEVLIQQLEDPPVPITQCNGRLVDFPLQLAPLMIAGIPGADLGNLTWSDLPLLKMEIALLMVGFSRRTICGLTIVPASLVEGVRSFVAVAAPTSGPGNGFDQFPPTRMVTSRSKQTHDPGRHVWHLVPLCIHTISIAITCWWCLHVSSPSPAGFAWRPRPWQFQECMAKTKLDPPATRRKIFRELQRKIHPDKMLSRSGGRRLDQQWVVEHRWSYGYGPILTTNNGL